ncbi:hypothetical protein VTL71DRAFT_10634 [Oculimacula yallundae]|uniref:Uncharacterized protein n=1 Tax=Oculimacula yallundae TaxID=86028 RepID=A0ABR4CTM7_9HELO
MQNYVLVLLALTSSVFANPIEKSLKIVNPRDTAVLTGEEGVIEDNGVDTISSLEFVGPIFPGGLNVTLFGTAQSVYEQIMALNPSYNVFDFPANTKDLEADGITRENIKSITDISTTPAVTVRSILSRQDGINCGIREKTLYYERCTEGYYYLRNLGSASCGAAANSCSRVSCSNHCGIWLCAKKSAKTVRCGSIAQDVVSIAAKCMQKDPYGKTTAHGRKAFSSHNVEFGSVGC